MSVVADADDDTPDFADLYSAPGTAPLTPRLSGDTPVYLLGYVSSLSVTPAQRQEAIEVLLPVWGRPSVTLWRHALADSVLALRRMSDQGVRLAIVSNSDGHVEEELRRTRSAKSAGVAVWRLLASSTLAYSVSPNRTHVCSLRLSPPLLLIGATSATWVTASATTSPVPSTRVYIPSISTRTGCARTHRSIDTCAPYTNSSTSSPASGMCLIENRVDASVRS
jgi:hypothetical protein